MPDSGTESGEATLGGDTQGFSFVLQSDESRGLQLHAQHRSGFGPVMADWIHADVRRRVAAGRHQPLARSVGLHKRRAGEPALTVLDATAGLGRDGYVLAALGARVSLAERNSTIVALLQDALRRAATGQPEVAARIEILSGDSKALFAGGRRWDAIYLDPMYPDDGKTALPGKEMQVLRDLTGGDADAEDLLKPAMACARSRVVVKRPLKAPWLGATRPTMEIASTQLRFDVYVIAAT